MVDFCDVFSLLILFTINGSPSRFDTSNTNINTIVKECTGARDADTSRALGKFFDTFLTFFLLYSMIFYY